MKAVTGKRLAKLAQEKGWRLARINGSHHIHTMEGRTERLVISPSTAIKHSRPAFSAP